MLNPPVRLLAASVIYLTLAGGCDFADGHPPVARIVVTPDAVLENDGFQTLITLDASGSSDPVDDPEGLRPLRYRWHISNDEFRFEDGHDASEMPTVRFRGDRPATIQLTSTDEDGFAGTTKLQLRLVVTNQ